VFNMKGYFGGTAWESNPADLARRSRAVLKTVRDTSTPFSPVSKDLQTVFDQTIQRFSL
jgi:hypothetical protein